jgi:M6 family metalloprotease-like protein
MKKALFVFIMMALTITVVAQDTFVCGVTGSMSNFPLLPKSGTLRALVIFCKFSDDTYDASPTTDGWPSSRSSLPDWALSGTIASSIGNYSFKSLSDYYYRMSGGRFNLLGDVYPDIVIPQHPSSYYTFAQGKNISYLTHEILNTVGSSVNLGLYDTWNRDASTQGADDIVDMIFIVFRHISNDLMLQLDDTPYTGVASLTGHQETFPDYTSVLNFNGKYIYAGDMGSGCFMRDIYNLDKMLKIAAHEMGHYYFGWGHFNGYGLMGDCGIMNAFEREQLGWINIQNINTDATGITIPSLINDSAAIKIVRPNGTFYVEGRYNDNNYQTQWFDNSGLKSPGNGILVIRKRLTEYQYDVLYANNIPYSQTRPNSATDYFNPGYNNLLSYYSHPSSGDVTDINFGIMFCAGANGKSNANIRIITSILNEPPSKPYNFRITNTTGWINLAWNANTEPDIAEYRIYRKFGNSAYELRATTSSSQTSFTDIELRLGGDQVVASYVVTAVDNTNLESVFSDPVTANGRYFPEKKNPNTPDILTNKLPQEFGLAANYPNPFNPSTTIGFALPEAGMVTLAIYDMTGKVTTTLISEYISAGRYTTTWNASGMASGMYFYRLHVQSESGKSFTETKKLVLMK